jgi:hypothetical protein
VYRNSVCNDLWSNRTRKDIETMVKFESNTMEELEEEILQPEIVAKLGREAVLATLIGIEYDKEEVPLDTIVGDGEWIELGMSIETKRWREIFESNLQALIDCGEYQLLSMVKQLLDEDNDLIRNNEQLLD